MKTFLESRLVNALFLIAGLALGLAYAGGFVPQAHSAVEKSAAVTKAAAGRDKVDADVVLSIESPQTLYYNCANEMNVYVLGAGKVFNPVFTEVEGGELITSKTNPRRVTVVPKSRKFSMPVLRNANGELLKVDQLTYNVIKPPRPYVQLFVNGRQHNGTSPIPKKSNLELKVVPDMDFRLSRPKDARYVISGIDLLAQRGLGAPTKVAHWNTSGQDAVQGLKVPLGSTLAADPPGTRIYLKFDDLYRINFQNKKVAERIAERDHFFGMIVK